MRKIKSNSGVQVQSRRRDAYFEYNEGGEYIVVCEKARHFDSQRDARTWFAATVRIIGVVEGPIKVGERRSVLQQTDDGQRYTSFRDDLMSGIIESGDTYQQAARVDNPIADNPEVSFEDAPLFCAGTIFKVVVTPKTTKAGRELASLDIEPLTPDEILSLPADVPGAENYDKYREHAQGADVDATDDGLPF